MEITPKDLKNMSDEEVAELNRKLGKLVMKRLAWTMGIKWALIIGTSYAVKKYLENHQDEEN